MRVLYTDLHLHSLNPTNTLMAAMVASAADVTRYGPGFVSPSILNAGVARFVEQTGPYDVIFLGPNVPVVQGPESWPDSLAYMQRYAALAPSPESGLAYLRDLFAALPGLPVQRRIACLVTLDYYGTVQMQIDRLQALDLHVLAPDLAFAPRIEELPDWLTGEEHFKRKRHRLSNAWADFIDCNPQRVLSSLHFVAESEFFFRSLEGRGNMASVPGVEYLLRAKAQRELRKKGITPASKAIFNAYRLLNKLRLPVFARFVPLKVFNLTYQASLLNTKFVYTARGGFGIPVRKFLEIPAAGAVMICTPPLGFAQMGFRDGEHYIEAAPEAAADIINELARDPERAQSIADGGRNLVWRQHSLVARAAQLRQCIDAMVAGTYSGSCWDRGEFVVEEVPSCAA